MVSLLEADLYQEKYEEFQELGKGAFGVVFQVKDRDNGQCHAAKHMKIKKPMQKDQIMEEIRILQNLTHPKIIRFNEAYEKKGKIILVTEYLNGGELFERIVSDDFSLTESDCAEFMKQIIQGVQYLHRNDIVHLDLKPENVICVNKDSMDIKIIDFGLARKLFPGSQIKMMCGTPEYLAPEIVSYDNISTASDMWTLGVVCYILISGFSPFVGDIDAETYNNISMGEYDFDEPEFDSISQNAKDFIAGLLQKAPQKRLSADQSLTHAWLVQQQSQAVLDTNNLKKFLNKRRWRKALNVGVAIKKMSGLGSTPASVESSKRSSSIICCKNISKNHRTIVTMSIDEVELERARRETAHRKILVCRQIYNRLGEDEDVGEDENVGKDYDFGDEENNHFGNSMDIVTNSVQQMAGLLRDSRAQPETKSGNAPLRKRDKIKNFFQRAK